ncbi:MAG: hypothetical protein N3I86_14160, partial [Verrucomicrobiae bacterium]|nr:hypothetical protein [Verrucomicrobiae bacterium]
MNPESNEPVVVKVQAGGASRWSEPTCSDRRVALAVAVLLAAVTLGVYAPVLRHDFVNMDDQVYVTENFHVQQGLRWASVRWAFTNLDACFWHPLTWLSHLLDCQIFGLWAGGHHLSSVL